MLRGHSCPRTDRRSYLIVSVQLLDTPCVLARRQRLPGVTVVPRLGAAGLPYKAQYDKAIRQQRGTHHIPLRGAALLPPLCVGCILLRTIAGRTLAINAHVESRT